MTPLPKAATILVFFLAACDPVPLQYPPGPTTVPTGPTAPASSPSANASQAPTQPALQISGAQRSQYVWERMLEGVAMGGSIGGPFGALGGLGLGLIYGLATADSHYERLNAQIQAEQAKDKDLEAQLEREIGRQRELEGQLGKTVEGGEKGAAGEFQLAEKPVEKKVEPKAEEKKAEPVALASLGRKEPEPLASPFKNIEIRDSNGDGIPDLWIYYHPLKLGEIVRQEEDTDADGRVDTWSYFNNGRMVRREVDSRKAGSPDRVYHYDGEQIAREERDENGDGRMSFRAYYQNGRLARVEKDLDRDGRIDLWIYYDTTKEIEVVVKEERDLNGDGAVDLWSYYESGRLARRDVSAAGLEILSKQEEIPTLLLNPQAPLPPGSLQ